MDLNGIVVNGFAARYADVDGNRWVKFATRLLRAILGLSSAPENCVLTEMRDELMGKRLGKRRRSLPIAIGKDGSPFSTVEVDVRGVSVRLLAKPVWPIHVEANSLEHVLRCLQEDAQA